MNETRKASENYGFFAMAQQAPATSPRVSIVAPVYNEEGGLDAMINEIACVFAGIDFEIIAVDDGSSDGSATTLEALRAVEPRLRILRHGGNAGKSRAVRTGVLAARAGVIVTLDGDGQNDPTAAAALIEKLTGNVAMVAGERVGRYDGTSRKIASRLANGVRRRLLRDGCADTGCGLKVFRRDAFLRLPYFDNMHRYMPALMRREGFEVAFAPVNDRPRAHGRSKYTNLGRFLVGFLDLFGVMWLNARAKTPISIRERRD